MNKKIVIPLQNGKAVSILEILAKRKAELWAKVEGLMPFKNSNSSHNSTNSAKKGGK